MNQKEVAAPCKQKRLAEYSQSGLRAGEVTTSLHREEVAQALNTTEVTCQDDNLDTEDHGGSAQPIGRKVSGVETLKSMLTL